MIVFKNLTQKRQLSKYASDEDVERIVFFLNNSNDSFIYETLSSMQFTINIIMS